MNHSTAHLKLSQLTLITWPLIPDGVHLNFFNEVWEETEARPINICQALSMEASDTTCLCVWYDIVRNRTHDLLLTARMVYHWASTFYVVDEGELLYIQLPDSLPGLPLTSDEDFQKKSKDEKQVCRIGAQVSSRSCWQCRLSLTTLILYY